MSSAQKVYMVVRIKHVAHARSRTDIDFYQNPDSVAATLDDAWFRETNPEPGERADELGKLVNFLVDAPPGTVVDGWYSANWIVVVDGNLPTDSGERPFIEVTDFE